MKGNPFKLTLREKIDNTYEYIIDIAATLRGIRSLLKQLLEDKKEVK